MNASLISFLTTLAGIAIRLRRRIGVIGILGAAMLVVAGYSAWQAPRWKNEAATMQTRTEAERQRLEALSRDVASRPNSNAQIAQFVGWFPRFEQNTKDMAKIFDQASAQQIAVPKGEYQFHREPTSEFVTYDVILPVRDRYASVRRFVAGVLKDVPHAALTELRIERPNADSEIVEARVHFTLIYRGA